MENSMQQLRQQCLSCENCPLAKPATTWCLAWGWKARRSSLLAKARAKTRTCRASRFGRQWAGALLDKHLTAIDLSRDKNIYITNMGQVPPAAEPQEPQAGGNRQLHLAT